MSETKGPWTPLALILLLCLAVRLGSVLVLQKHPYNLPMDGYPEIAENILAGEGLSPTPLSQWYFRTPGYPLFIAAVWSVVPPFARYIALEVAQVFLSVATCGLLFAIANAVFGRRAALTAALLFALSPSDIVFSIVVLSETLQLFLIALAVLMSLRLYTSARLWTAIGLGLSWGAAGLTRPEATFVLAPLLLPILVASHIRIPARLRLCATAVLTKIAVMAPWVVRNYVVYGTFVLHVPLGGLGLFAGTYEYGPGDNFMRITITKEYREITGPFWDPEFLARTVGQDEHEIPDPFILVARNERDMLEVDRRLAAAGLTHIKNNPLFQFYNLPHHIYKLWGVPSAWQWVVRPRSLDYFWLGGYLGLLVLFVLGVDVAWKTGDLKVVPLSWLILTAFHTGLILVVNAEARYQFTSTIFLFIFSGYGIAAFLPFPALGTQTAAGPGNLVAERVSTGP